MAKSSTATKTGPVDELAELRAENERLKAANAPKALTFKVSAKGGVSVYGLQRFPVTLYKDQWARVLQAAPELAAFIAENQASLTVKD